MLVMEIRKDVEMSVDDTKRLYGSREASSGGPESSRVAEWLCGQARSSSTSNGGAEPCGVVDSAAVNHLKPFDAFASSHSRIGSCCSTCADQVNRQMNMICKHSAMLHVNVS